SRRIDEARKRRPDWKAGQALQALVACRTARYDEAERLIKGLLDSSDDDQLNAYGLWIIGNELENHTSTKALAQRVYERATEGRLLSSTGVSNFRFSPMKRLIDLYVKDGRKDDARRLLLAATKVQENPGYPDEYLQQMRMQSLSAVASQLADLGFTADA